MMRLSVMVGLVIALLIGLTVAVSRLNNEVGGTGAVVLANDVDSYGG
jgi:hypothetical protein